jgi:uncharacterized sulfatase
MERVCQKLTVSVIGMNNTYKTLLLVLFTILVFKGTGTARPNVVYIISDDQAFADFGFMGHPFVKTPHLDKLAEQSAVFPNGYLTASVCRPSLMTLLTGRYQFQHGVHFNHPPPGSQALTNDPNLNKVEYDRIREEACDLIRNTSSLPRILAAKGYRCFQTGKYWEGHWRNAGFTEGMTIAEPSNAKNGNRILANGDVVAHGNGDAGLAIGRETMQPISKFLDSCGADQPFMLWYAPFLPHTPHDSPEEYSEFYRNRGLPEHEIAYYSSISWFDETVGTLIEAIEERGLSDDTLFVFVVDNGFEPHPEHRNAYTKNSKRSPYDLGLRTPILLRWDGVIQAGTHEGLVSSIDLFPTILDACNINNMFQTPGSSLFPAATGKSKLDPRRAVFGAIYPGNASVLGNPAADVAYRWVRHENYKLIVPRSANPWGNYLNEISLFNIVDDPYETVDLSRSEEHQETLRAMRVLLDSWWNPELIQQ